MSFQAYSIVIIFSRLFTCYIQPPSRHGPIIFADGTGISPAVRQECDPTGLTERNSSGPKQLAGQEVEPGIPHWRSGLHEMDQEPKSPATNHVLLGHFGVHNNAEEVNQHA